MPGEPRAERGDHTGRVARQRGIDRGRGQRLEPGRGRLTVVEARKLARRFGRTDALRGADVAVRSGEITALLGPNGSGKTTLMHGLAGLLALDGGEVTVDGAPATSGGLRETMFYLPDGIRPWTAQPVWWLLEAARSLFAHDGAGGAERDARSGGPGNGMIDDRIGGDVRAVLRIDALASQRAGALSKGEAKRVLLAFALTTMRPLLVLDEPFDGLDLRLTRETVALLRREAERGRGFLLSIHDMANAERVADRLVLLDGGRTVAEGTATELRARAGPDARSLEDVFLALAP